MRLFNNYFKVYENTCIMDIASEMGLEPWKLGEILIKMIINLYNEMGKDQNLDKNHTEFAKLQEMAKKREPLLQD